MCSNEDVIEKVIINRKILEFFLDYIISDNLYSRCKTDYKFDKAKNSLLSQTITYFIIIKP